MNVERLSNTNPTTNFKAKCVILDRTNKVPKDLIEMCKDTVIRAGKDTDNVIIEFTNDKSPNGKFWVQGFIIDEHNKIIRGQWKGESCPMTQFGGKKWINPKNNPWNK